MRAPAEDRPPPIRRSAADQARMERWINKRLDALLDAADRQRATEIEAWRNAPDFDQSVRELVKEARARLHSDATAIEATQRGDLEPARRKWPELAAADMLQLPRRPGKGKHFPKDGGLTDYEHDLTEAVWDAAKIRALWHLEYEHRPRGYDAPEDIAAGRWGVSGEVVRGWANNRRCPKIPPELLPR
jgi:hypothetical protein